MALTLGLTDVDGDSNRAGMTAFPIRSDNFPGMPCVDSSGIVASPIANRALLIRLLKQPFRSWP